MTLKVALDGGLVGLAISLEHREDTIVETRHHAAESNVQNLPSSVVNMSAKVACKLLELHLLTATSDGAPIPLELPQGRLASMLGASRENVNRALAAYRSR